MKGIKNTWLLITALCAINGTQAQGRMEMTPERPFIGDTVKILYHPDPALIATGKPIQATMYVYDTLYHWAAEDLPLKTTGNKYEAKIVLTPDRGLWAFKFRAGDVTDSNKDTGYIIMGAQPGRQYKGAYAGYGALRAERYGIGIPGYYDHFQVSDSAFFFWMGQEIGYHRAGRQFVLPYLTSCALMTKQAGLDPDSAKTIRSAATYMLHAPNLSEKDLFTTAIIFDQFMHNKGVADSIRNAMNQQYPNGIIKKQAAYKAIQKATDVNTRLSLSEQFVKDFPPSEDADQMAMDKLADIDYDRGVFRNIYAISIANKDTSVLAKYINISPVAELALAYYKMVEIPYDDWKTMPAKEAYPFSQRIIDRLDYLKQHKPAAYYYYSPLEWAAYLDKIFMHDYIIHTAILKETGREKEALVWATRIQEDMQFKNATLNTIQAVLLEKAGKKQQLSEVLHSSVKMNQASGQILDMLKKEYLQTHANTDGFDAYLATMKDAHTMELMREDIKKNMISRESAPFIMKDLNGKDISLAAQAGKVVVMDFWATWCAPCKAAMPGMKMAMEHFKNDTNVVFFFVDTQERDPNYKEKVKAFLKEKNFPFKVLFDNGDEYYTKYAKLIQTSGIPFKIVIDAKGKIRFGQTGYMGSPSGLADEIIEMINLAKQG